MCLGIRVETRTGDTPHARKARQRIMPPQMLLTTPESLSLMLSWPDAERMFGSLSTVIIDEVHAFAPTKRGDLLNLALSRLERFRPGFSRVALSATLQDPSAHLHCPAPADKQASPRLLLGENDAAPPLTLLLPKRPHPGQHPPHPSHT